MGWGWGRGQLGETLQVVWGDVVRMLVWVVLGDVGHAGRC